MISSVMELYTQCKRNSSLCSNGLIKKLRRILKLVIQERESRKRWEGSETWSRGKWMLRNGNMKAHGKTLDDAMSTHSWQWLLSAETADSGGDLRRTDLEVPAGHISYIRMAGRMNQSGFGARTRENSRYLKQKVIQYSKLDICKICRRYKEFITFSELSTKQHRTENRTIISEASTLEFCWK